MEANSTIAFICFRCTISYSKLFFQVKLHALFVCCDNIEDMKLTRCTGQCNRDTCSCRDGWSGSTCNLIRNDCQGSSSATLCQQVPTVCHDQCANGGSCRTCSVDGNGVKCINCRCVVWCVSCSVNWRWFVMSRPVHSDLLESTPIPFICTSCPLQFTSCTAMNLHPFYSTPGVNMKRITVETLIHYILLLSSSY